MDADDILEGLLRGALSGRGKRWGRTGRALRGGSLVNARTLLAAAGVAWGLFETWQQQQAGKTPTTGGPAPAGPPPGATRGAGLPTPPPVGADTGAIGLPEPVVRLVRLMISAARADGDLGPAERDRILEEARGVGAEPFVAQELQSPRPLADIVGGVTDPGLKADLYTVAFSIVRADETVGGGERIYLAKLAHLLGLDASTAARLEAEAAARIDAEPGDEAGPR